eukprot:gene36316-59398_t
MTRLVSGEPAAFEPADKALRPQTMAEFVGQKQAKGNLSIFIEAAKNRGEALDHVLLFGPPGLGKTTLAQIVARELGVNFRATSGPVLAKAGVTAEPQSMEQFFAALDKIKASGAIPLALGGQTWQEGILFNAILHTAGGADLYRKFYASTDGTVATSAEFKKILSDFKRLKGYVDAGSPNRDWNVATAM